MGTESVLGYAAHQPTKQMSSSQGCEGDEKSAETELLRKLPFLPPGSSVANKAGRPFVRAANPVKVHLEDRQGHELGMGKIIAAGDYYQNACILGHTH